MKDEANDEWKQPCRSSKIQGFVDEYRLQEERERNRIENRNSITIYAMAL